jgi:hypothetical protein
MPMVSAPPFTVSRVNGKYGDAYNIWPLCPLMKYYRFHYSESDPVDNIKGYTKMLCYLLLIAGRPSRHTKCGCHREKILSYRFMNKYTSITIKRNGKSGPNLLEGTYPITANVWNDAWNQFRGTFWDAIVYKETLYNLVLTEHLLARFFFDNNIYFSVLP